LFSPETIDVLSSFEPSTPAQENAVGQLRLLVELVNQAVGDAISDFLLVEVILAHKRWGPEEWDAGYEDLPNRLLKVNVPDRNAFITEDAERRLTSPSGMQPRLDEMVNKFERGRAFVRPSGTEDCVRVYAEASTDIGATRESREAWAWASWDRLTDGSSRLRSQNSVDRFRIWSRSFLRRGDALFLVCGVRCGCV
jgi:hypothetical protein